MNKLEQIQNLVTELKSIVSKMDSKTKRNIVLENKKLENVLIDSPNYFLSFFDEVQLFEKKYEIQLSEDLKKGLEIANFRGLYYSELFNHQITTYCPIDSFFSEKFVKLLIDHGIGYEAIKDDFYEFETKEFNNPSIEAVYQQYKEMPDLLINYISFAECCGGRRLLILNGCDQNIIAYDNHYSHKDLIYKGKTYDHHTYLLSESNETIFDLICKEITEIIITLKNISIK